MVAAKAEAMEIELGGVSDVVSGCSKLIEKTGLLQKSSRCEAFGAQTTPSHFTTAIETIKQTGISHCLKLIVARARQEEGHRDIFF